MSQKDIIGMAGNRRGGGLMLFLLSVAIAGILMIPLTRWYVSMTYGISDINKKLGIQTVGQIYWSNIDAASYDEFQELINKKGTTWTEDIDDKYKATVTFGADGKYMYAMCSVGTAAATTDRHCRNATILIESKEDPKLKYWMNTTKVSAVSELQDIKDLTAGVSTATSNFKSYYTKSQVDSKLNSYYTKAQTDEKLKNSPGGAPTTTGYYTFYTGNEESSRTFSAPAFCIIRMESDEGKHPSLNGMNIHFSDGPMAEPHFGNYTSYVSFLVNKGSSLYVGIHSKDGGGHHNESDLYGFCFPIK